MLPPGIIANMSGRTSNTSFGPAAAKREYGREYEYARHYGYQGVKTCGCSGAAYDRGALVEVAAVDHHSAHAERKREKCLAECADYHAAVDCAEVGCKEEVQALGRIGQKERVDTQNDKYGKEDGHQYVACPFDAFSYAAEQYKCVDSEHHQSPAYASPPGGKGIESCLSRHTAHVVDLTCERFVEVFECPTGHNRVKRQNEYRRQYAQAPDNDPRLAAARSERTECTEDIEPRRSSHNELCTHYRHTYCRHKYDI